MRLPELRVILTIPNGQRWVFGGLASMLASPVSLMTGRL